MSTTASDAAREVELLSRQAGFVRDVVRANVDGTTHEESLIQPRPGGNCLNWVVGHLLSVYDGTLPLLGRESVMEEGTLDRYARGSDPLTDPSDALDFGDLMSAWEEAAERFDAGLAELGPEDLDEPAPVSPTDDEDETVRSLLSLICFHQAYHAGQTALLRRIAGKEGAIR